MIFVIPSYQRAEVLRQKSLALLFKYGVRGKDIHVFIVDSPEQIAAYAYLKELDVNVHCGPVGLHNMRNHISKYFGKGTEMVCLDDDISDIVYMNEDVSIADKKSCKRYPLKSFPVDHFSEWLQGTFAWMRENNVNLFGIYPVRNGYFMKSSPAVTHDLRFCVGAFWGCINQPDIMLTIEEKEDVERTLKYFEADGAVLRYNHIAPVTRYYKTPGGMQSRGDRYVAAKESVLQLVATFSKLCSVYTGKKSGVHEAKLKRVPAARQIKSMPEWL
jgi:hypothetical protein